jgi:hypothetical protein
MSVQITEVEKAIGEVEEYCESLEEPDTSMKNVDVDYSAIPQSQLMFSSEKTQTVKRAVSTMRGAHPPLYEKVIPRRVCLVAVLRLISLDGQNQIRRGVAREYIDVKREVDPNTSRIYISVTITMCKFRINVSARNPRRSI